MSASFSIDKTFEDYLAIPTKGPSVYDIQYDWFPVHDAPQPQYEDYYPTSIPHSLFLHSPSTSESSSTSLPSPGSSDADQDSGDNSSGSETNSEPDQDQGSWTVRDGYAYHQASSSYSTVKDAPYMPPSAPIADHSTLSVPQYISPVAEAAQDFTNVPRASRQKANANLAVIFDGDSDADAEGESDGGFSEDEYVPSPRIQPRDRRTYQYAYHTSRSQSPNVASSSTGPRLRYPSVSPSQDTILRRTKPRHIQSSTHISVEHMINSSSSRWKCPHAGCNYVQRNRRMPDFKRHLQTHTRFLEPDRWVCCGIPLDDAPLDVIDESEPTLYAGQMMVGGCFKVFSRRDALKRHLDNKNIPCQGNLNGSWMPGNCSN